MRLAEKLQLQNSIPSRILKEKLSTQRALKSIHEPVPQIIGLNMLNAPVALSSRYSYHTIFTDICKTRFNHLATRLLLITTLSEALVLTILSRGYSSSFELLIIFPLRLSLLYLANLSIIICRKNYLHVQYRGYANLVKSTIAQLFCLRFVIYELIHCFCSLCISVTFSDFFGFSGFTSPCHEFMKCYRVLICIMIPTLYTLQHCIFDLDRLSFSFETHFNPPQQYISSSLKRIFTKSGIMTVLLTVCSPFVFFSVSSEWAIGFKDYLKLTVLTFCIFFNIEYVNVAFSAHMSIGCLHKGKPISSLSSTPMESLITGLSSNRLFTKLTAFQELSYRATSTDLSLRLPIYHTRYRNSHVWPEILKECLMTMQETNESVTNYLNALERSLRSQKNSNYKVRDAMGTDRDELFGNEASVSQSSSNPMQDRLPGAPPGLPDDVRHKITLKDDNVLLKRNLDSKRGRSTNPLDDNIQMAHYYNEPFMTHDTTLTTLLGTLITNFKNSISLFFFPSGAQPQDQTQQLSIIDAWCISKRRQAEKLVPLPVCHAECIVSLMGLLINALEEDPKGGVVSSVGEVLKCLERSVGALGRFADWNPDMVKHPTETQATPDAITILYDLSVSSFLEIVIKYNALLNDLYLDDDVVKLSRWVLDMCGQ